jgi:hypothetical protein
MDDVQNYNITIIIQDIIHRPVFYLKNDVSDSGFCVRFQVKPTQFVLRKSGLQNVVF